ncbi:MAG: hypothetical protein MI824_22225 [Hyphomicrobiales bacterium]|nr:hypothetical protein [Hyphomicrobiales bacterium]
MLFAVLIDATETLCIRARPNSVSPRSIVTVRFAGFLGCMGCATGGKDVRATGRGAVYGVWIGCAAGRLDLATFEARGGVPLPYMGSDGTGGSAAVTIGSSGTGLAVSSEALKTGKSKREMPELQPPAAKAAAKAAPTIPYRRRRRFIPLNWVASLMSYTSCPSPSKAPEV